MARRRELDRVDPDEDDATTAIEHYGKHVIGDAPDPECELCDRRHLWSVQQGQRGRPGQP